MVLQLVAERSADGQVVVDNGRMPVMLLPPAMAEQQHAQCNSIDFGVDGRCFLADMAQDLSDLDQARTAGEHGGHGAMA